MSPQAPRPAARGLLLPVLSGLLMGASFQPWGVWWLVLVGLVPLLHSLGAAAADERQPLRRGFRVGFAFGFAMFAVMVHWILLLTTNHLPHWSVMIPLYLLMSAYLAIFPGLFGLLLVASLRRTRLPLAILAPPLWVAVEWLRGAGELGFPWGNAGYSLVAHLPFLQAAAWAGVPGLSLLVVAVNVALWLGIAARGPLRAAPIAALAALAALHVSGSARLRDNPPGAAADVTVAILQPNIPQGVKWDWEHKDRSVDAAARLMRRIDPGTVDLAVWPETAIPSYLRVELGYFELVKAIIEESDTPTLLGFPDTEIKGGEREFYNAALYLNADGSEAGEYYKMHLVPFGETFPFQDVIPLLKKIDFGEADFTPGSDIVLFPLGDERFGVSICFEAIFPPMTRELVRRGAALLVNLTNDAWYGRSSAAWQHSRMALVRSVESGVCQVRSANTGISFACDPFGRLLQESEIFVEDILIVALELRRVPTFYQRHGDRLLDACRLFSLLALVAAALPVPWLSRR